MVSKITGLMVIVNVAINLALIPQFSYVGASIAIIITEFIALVLFFFLAEREHYVHRKTELASIVLRIIVASAIMGLFIAYLQNLNLIFLIVSASLLYFVTLYIVKGIKKEDILLIKSIVQASVSKRKTE